MFEVSSLNDVAIDGELGNLEAFQITVLLSSSLLDEDKDIDMFVD